jgi:hypothetical protein
MPRLRPGATLIERDVMAVRDAASMTEDIEETSDPRMWKKSGWIARVIKNENDEGWAASMMRIGDSEPVLVSPWTMGRDKVNPKPLDHAGFATLLKGAKDVLRRHEAALHARLHRSMTFAIEDQRVRADLDIQPDEDDPHAILSVIDERTGDVVRRGRVSPSFKLAESSVQRFVRAGEG